MTNELEKQFFDTFGIEPKPYCCYHDCNCPINDVGKFNSKCPKQAVTKERDARIIQNPQITDRILLELICIDNQENIYKCRPLANNVEELKTYILEEFIRLYELGLFKRVHQVRTLFEEG